MTQTAPHSSAYAEARQRKREEARRRIHEQVLHPIDTPSLLRDPLFHPTSKIHKTIGGVKLLAAAVAVHIIIILVFAAVNDLMGKRASFTPPERVVLTVIETAQPPIDEEEEDPLAITKAPVPPDFTPKPSEPPPKPKPLPRKRTPKKAPPPKVAKPKESTPPGTEQTPAPARRRTLGISYESTTSGSKGPNMATGTSRMGTTATTAADPSEARVPATAGSQREAGDGARPLREQRKAANIPTRDTVFVKPRRLAPSTPPYPETLKAQGIEGDVQVRVRLSAKGEVENVTILRSSGHSAFDEAARRAALREAFAPATRDGVQIAYTLSYSYRFRIEDT